MSSAVIKGLAEGVHALNKDRLDEWFQVLVRKNSDRIQKASSLPKPEGYFSTDKFMQFICVTCQEHILPKQVCYMAAEVFESFMQAHIKEMFEHVRGQVVEQAEQKLEWNKVLERIKHQAVLRALSCVQIASKHDSHYKHITCHQVKAHLRKLGHKYSDLSIKKSELRVLKTIGFNVENCTALSYLDVVVAKLDNRREEELPKSANQSFSTFSPQPKIPFKMTSVEMYREMGIKLLDLVLIDKQAIYQSFADVITSSQASSQDDRRLIYAIQSDYILMTASIVVASSLLFDQSQTNQLVSVLEEMLLINLSDLVDLATVIVKSFAFEQQPQQQQ